MMKCSMCKENLAVVFITKIVNGKQTQEGLCFSCAKKRGIQPINQILEQTGISEDEIDDLNKQMGSFLEEMDINSSDEDGSDMELPSNANSLFNLINKSLLKSGENSGLKESKDLKDEDKEDKEDKEEKEEKEKGNKSNSTRTKTQEKKIPKKKKYLDAYGINLTVKAKEGKIDRVIGRQREIDRVIQILNRRSKNNPVLIGEPGVGKTAI
ncbi:MAG: ATP-dependent Clp protease ATP-binding subunit, partial [Clostridiaceae bacterium]|nr:ATP-dependent Clp protease ATP-binding subunit [Clostridiaceae bacterium]